MAGIPVRALIAASLLLGAPSLWATDGNNVVGDWTLCEDPDGGRKDFLHFEADGTGALRHGGVTTPFAYKLDGLALVLTMHLDERPDEFRLALSEDGRKILAFDARTNNTSFYVRESETASFGCTVE